MEMAERRGLNAASIVVACVAMHYGTPRILEATRSKTTNLARQVALYICRSYIRPTPSYPELGRWFRRDHTTAMHAVRRIEWLRGRDQSLEQSIRIIRADIRKRLAKRLNA